MARRWAGAAPAEAARPDGELVVRDGERRVERDGPPVVLGAVLAEQRAARALLAEEEVAERLDRAPRRTSGGGALRPAGARARRGAARARAPPWRRPAGAASGSSARKRAASGATISARAVPARPEHLVEQHAQREEVRPRVLPRAAQLLGRHVPRRPALRRAADAEDVREPEVEHLHAAIDGEDHVRGLEVAVEDAGGVGVDERSRDGEANPDRLARRERPARRPGRRASLRAAARG